MSTIVPSGTPFATDARTHCATLGLLADHGERIGDFVSLGALLDGIGRLFATEALRKGIVLHCHVARPLRTALRIDSLRLRHILANFVGNALKDVDSGEIRIDARTIAVDDDGAAGLQFVVSDTAAPGAATAHASACSTVQTPDDGRRPWMICERLAGEMGGSIHLEADEGGRITRTLILLLPRIAGEQSAALHGRRTQAAGDHARRRPDRSMAR